jgi:two-component system cell cycle sensor histidine kinase/response regulator CckA
MPDTHHTPAAPHAPSRGAERFRALLARGLDPVLLFGPDGAILHATPAGAAIMGYRPVELENMSGPVLIHPAAMAAVLAAPDATEAVEYRARHKDGTWRWLEARAVNLLHEPDVGALVVSFRDVTRRREAEDAAHAWNARYEAAVKATGQMLYEWNAGTDRVTWAGSCEATLGYPEAEMPGDVAGWRDWVHPDDRAAFDREAERSLASGAPFRLEYRVRRRDGSFVVVDGHGHFLPPVDGRASRQVGFVVDVTARKQLEEKLRQSQRMDAFGQLAGGVAHDFNNMLQVINGYADLLLGHLAPGDEKGTLVGQIPRAGEKSAALTRQLLAFARKEVAAPRLVDVTAVVTDTMAMLRRLIGEDVRLATDLPAGVWPVFADPGQVEQVLLNLAVNARDAMPGGGSLTVSVRNETVTVGAAAEFEDAKAGPHAVLSVTDTGCGMPPEVRARIFEPFYTTKGVGKGTGLGLATVYGIVKQTGGHIRVRSKEGAGTTFEVFLPRTGQAETEADTKSGVRAIPPGTETVLVLEDEAAVRGLVKLVLTGCGYTVLEAADGEAAEKVASEFSGPIHLVLSDVVMPGAGGRVAAAGVMAKHPEAKVVFMSGYTDDAVVRQGVSAADVPFLQKPFTPATLAAKVRQVLDAPR